MELRPYQNAAATFMYERSFSMMLASVGAGKTASALTVMKDLLADGQVHRFLVLAPKRVCTHVWVQEAAKWAPGLTVIVASGTPAHRTAAFASGAQVVVMAYDNLQWLTAEHIKGFDGLILDELTRLKNASGQRFKALFKLIKQFTTRIGLTGSFTSNGLEDCFGQCKIVDQTLLGRSKGAFLQQYFYLINKDFNQWEPRPGALEAVMERIKPATFVLDAGDYKTTPLHTVEVRCDMDMTDYKTMKRDFVVQFPDALAIAMNAGVVTQKLRAMSSGFIYLPETLWLSSHKFDALADLLDENQHANTIIVYNFIAELEELKRRYPQAQTLDDTDAIARWNAGEIELLLLQPQGASHGLNLQPGGHHMVFLSLPWSLELFEQTIGRLHRSGQTHPVWCYVMVTNGTIDERILAALRDKRSLSDIAMKELT